LGSDAGIGWTFIQLCVSLQPQVRGVALMVAFLIGHVCLCDGALPLAHAQDAIAALPGKHVPE